MKASFLKASLIILLIILSLIFALTGYKKTTPQPQELTAEEKEFLSAPDATVCELQKTKISKLDLPKGSVASNFFRYMEAQNRHYIKQGQITLANRPFKIILGFHPEQEFYVYDIEKGFGPSWSGSQSLYSFHKFDDKFFEFMLIENGTKIAARPYPGPFGIIKFSKGSRESEKVKFWGSLKKENDVAVPIGTIKENRPDMVTECAIPVGDYKLSQMYITYDNLLIRTSDNSTNTQGRFNHQDIVYGIHVRQDKPYVLDFSNEPNVTFNQYPMNQTVFSRGNQIKFTTVLIDPKLNIKIWGLEDTSVKVNKQYKDRDGTVHTITVNKSLAPKIVITRAEGEVLAEGVMPFG
jgi:hypothetical protein